MPQKALNIFNAALVTPTYYVYFTSATIVTSAILFRGFHGTPVQITTIVLGFLVICSGVVLLQLSKSAKDVPDAQVFAGDLNQVRTVAEQEEHESEPKADAIRGTAALIRSFSKGKVEREKSEARRVQADRLEPIGENELVEWDGLRRRKTVLEPGQPATPHRTRSIHPPWGLTRMPSDETLRTDNHDPDYERHPHAGLFSLQSLRSPNKKTHTLLTPRSSSKRARRDFSGQSDLAAPDVSDRESKAPYDMSAIRRDVSGSSASTIPRYDTDGDLSTGTHVFGLPPNLQHEEEDTSYHSPRTQGHISFADPARPHTGSTGPPPTPPPHQVEKRQFSFQNMFGSKRSDMSGDGAKSPSLTHTRSFFSRSGGSAGVSEEERLGLVSGDGGSADSTPVKKYQNERDRQRREYGDEGGGSYSKDLDLSSSDEDVEEYENIGMKDFGASSRSGSSGESEGGGGGGAGVGGRGRLV